MQQVATDERPDYITSLERQLAERGGTGASLLVLTCADSNLDFYAEPVAQHRATLVLRTPGGAARLAGDQPHDPLDAASWAVDVAGIEHLVVCGHSRCSAVAAAPQPAASGWSQVLAGATRVQWRIAQAKRHALQQLQQVTADARIAERVRSGRLQVHGLFYLDESSLFLGYDPRTGGYGLVLGEL